MTAGSRGRRQRGRSRGVRLAARRLRGDRLAVARIAPTPHCRTPARSGLEIIFRPDPTIWDGRFANNGWLQELPKPLTKITWDPTAWISPRLAEEQKLRDGDIIELKYRGNTAKLPVAIVPGHPDGAVTAFFGYGRSVTGRVGTSADEVAKEFDVYRLRTSDALWFGSGLEIAKTGDRYLHRAHAGTPPDGRPRPGARRDARGVPARTRRSSHDHGREAAAAR